MWGHPETHKEGGIGSHPFPMMPTLEYLWEPVAKATPAPAALMVQHVSWSNTERHTDRALVRIPLPSAQGRGCPLQLPAVPPATSTAAAGVHARVYTGGHTCICCEGLKSLSWHSLTSTWGMKPAKGRSRSQPLAWEDFPSHIITFHSCTKEPDENDLGKPTIMPLSSLGPREVGWAVDSSSIL